MHDIAIVGAGPAGLSAAINARQRDKSVIVYENPSGESWLSRAERLENVPGMPGISGPALLRALREHALAMGARIERGRVRQILAMDDQYMLAVDDEFADARAVILAMGARQPKLLPGEARLLGMGVSYCATCDGMLYRGKTIAVILESAEAMHEVNFLATLAARVLLFARKPVGEPMRANVELRADRPRALAGEDTLRAVETDAGEAAVDGVFILRDAIALSTLLPELALDGSFIGVDRMMRTNLPRVYAAGDCAGKPLQVAKAIGEGCVAALTAAEELDRSAK